VTSSAAVFDVSELGTSSYAVACEVRAGLMRPTKSLSPWLFYDEIGSELFEQITRVPEYYLTRTERELFEAHSPSILQEMGLPAAEEQTCQDSAQPAQLRRRVTIAELGAGTGTKTGILLRTLAAVQRNVVYQPIDVSASALEHATKLQVEIPGVVVRPRVANYAAEEYRIDRTARCRVLALYIGSSIGNFAPEEARSVLKRLSAQLLPGDGLLLGTDRAPGRHKSVDRLRAAYDDAKGITARFNRNVLTRLNRELGANFALENFEHVVIWNPGESRIEMHLKSTTSQTVKLPPNSAGPAMHIQFRAGETIHTENSYKFTEASVAELLSSAGFEVARTFLDTKELFALTLAKVI